MIKVGDKVKLKKYDETIYTVVYVEDEHVRVINNTGTQLMQIRKDFIEVVSKVTNYKSLYEQQKQRADELERKLNKEIEESKRQLRRWYEELKRADRAEKRWEKLKEHFINEKEQSFGILSWSRNDGMLELMEQLEEDGE